MNWKDFVELVCNELQTGKKISNFKKKFNAEIELTHEIGFGIRKLFSSNFDVPYDSSLISEYVVFREGATSADKKAWTNSKKDKWIYFHELFFVPDILIRKAPGNPKNIFSVEVKLVKGTVSPQRCITEALGQSLIYLEKHYPVIAFIGVTNSVKWGKLETPQITPSVEDQSIYEEISKAGIKLILRQVGS